MGRLKNKIRGIVFEHLSDNQIDSFYKIYYKVRYPDELMKNMSYGDLNEDKTLYLIRPKVDGTEGLMSLLVNVLRHIYYAQENDYIPFVDFENYHTQYDDFINGNKNSWEFYFTQPSNLTLAEVYQSKNVVLSGLDMKISNKSFFKQNFDDQSLISLHNFMFKYIDFNSDVKLKVDNEIKKLGINTSETLGLYLRGTDYIKLKPAGHPVQPTSKQAIKVVDDFIKKHDDITKIFLVTEDGEIYKEIKQKYKDKCVVVTFDSFINDYDGKNFLSHTSSINELDDSPYIRGLNYLIKIVILSKCGYFVGGNTMGSWASLIFSGDGYKEKYVFDLGMYGK